MAGNRMWKALFLAIMAAATAAAACAAGLDVWVEDALVKVLPEAEPPRQPAPLLDLTGPRGGLTIGQVVVRSAQELPAVSLDLSMDRIRAMAQFVGYVPVQGRPFMTPAEELVVDTSEQTREIPDPLLPDTEIALAPGRAQAVWVRLYPGVDAEPGLYEGTLTIRAGGDKTDVPVKFTLVNAVVPQERSYRHFNYFIPQDRIATNLFSSAFGGNGWTSDDWEFLTDIVRSRVAHRHSVFEFDFWRGVKIYIDYEDDTYKTDFSWMDKFIAAVLREDSGACFEAIGFGQFYYAVPREIPPGWDPYKNSNDPRAVEIALSTPLTIYEHYRYDGQSPVESKIMTTIDLPAAVMSPKVTAVLDGVFRDLEDYLQKKGLAGRFYMSIKDEVMPHMAASYREIAAFIKERAPSVKITDAVRTKEVAGAIDAWRPFVQHFEIDPGFYYARQAAGDELLSYYCVAPAGYAVNRFFVTPLLKTRLAHWITFKYGITGFLHWAYIWDYMPPNVEKPIRAMDGGDWFLVWRGPGNRPLDSIRSEADLNGIEDYELLFALKRRAPHLAQALADYAVKDSLHFTRNIREFRAAHAALLQLAGMSDAELKEHGEDVIKGLPPIEPMRPLQAAKSTANDAAPWKLVFEDSFEDSGALWENWEMGGKKPPANPEQYWRVEDGWLTLPQGVENSPLLFLKRPFPGAVRVEYDCRSKAPKQCDLSIALALKEPESSVVDGYFFGFGSEMNAFSKFMRAGVELEWRKPVISENKTHRVAVERDGNTVRHFVDNEKILEYLDLEPLQGEDCARIAFYVYTHGQFDNVKVYSRE